MKSLASKKIENLWAKESLSSWTEAANVGLWQYLSPWFIYLAQGSWCPHWATACHSPFPVGGSTQIFYPANVFTPSCLVCLCQLTEIPHMLPWRCNRGKGKHCELAANTRWIQTGRCCGPGRANRCLTVAGLCRGWYCASQNNLCLLLVFDLNRLSFDQKQWHVWLSWKFPFTSSAFARVHFDLFNIPTNINLGSTHT